MAHGDVGGEGDWAELIGGEEGAVGDRLFGDGDVVVGWVDDYGRGFDGDGKRVVHDGFCRIRSRSQFRTLE